MKKYNVKWKLVIYDIIILLCVEFLLLYLYQSGETISNKGIIVQSVITLICVFAARFIGRIYQQIWRYGGIQCYLRLLFVDGCAFLGNFILE